MMPRCLLMTALIVLPPRAFGATPRYEIPRSAVLPLMRWRIRPAPRATTPRERLDVAAGVRRGSGALLWHEAMPQRLMMGATGAMFRFDTAGLNV